jgi:hypothetical protein
VPAPADITARAEHARFLVDGRQSFFPLGELSAFRI